MKTLRELIEKLELVLEKVEDKEFEAACDEFDAADVLKMAADVGAALKKKLTINATTTAQAVANLSKLNQMENQMTDSQLIQIVIYFNVLILWFLSIFYFLNAVKNYNFACNTVLRQKRLDMLKRFNKYEGLTISSQIVARGLKLKAFE